MYARHLTDSLKQSNLNDCRMPSIALKVIFPGEPSRVAPTPSWEGGTLFLKGSLPASKLAQ